MFWRKIFSWRPVSTVGVRARPTPKSIQTNYKKRRKRKKIIFFLLISHEYALVKVSVNWMSESDEYKSNRVADGWGPGPDLDPGQRMSYIVQFKCIAALKRWPLMDCDGCLSMAFLGNRCMISELGHFETGHWHRFQSVSKRPIVQSMFDVTAVHLVRVPRRFDVNQGILIVMLFGISSLPWI